MTQPPTLDTTNTQITELTRHHTHAERYTSQIGSTSVTRNHVVRVPPLLTQLGWIAPTGRGDDRNGGGYESRPAAALEALNILVQIDTDAARWLRVLGESDYGDTTDLLRRLAAQLPRLRTCHRSRLGYDRTTGAPCCVHHQITNAITRWWTQARIVSGWDSAAWRPDSTCPVCGNRGSIRVKEVEKIGFCVDCHETWTPDTIGLLAEHIRLETAERRTTRAAASVCWCPVQRPAFERWPRLCPSCGSPYCHRASTSGRIAG